MKNMYRLLSIAVFAVSVFGMGVIQLFAAAQAFGITDQQGVTLKENEILQLQRFCDYCSRREQAYKNDFDGKASYFKSLRNLAEAKLGGAEDPEINMILAQELSKFERLNSRTGRDVRRFSTEPERNGGSAAEDFSIPKKLEPDLVSPVLSGAGAAYCDDRSSFNESFIGSDAVPYDGSIRVLPGVNDDDSFALTHRSIDTADADDAQQE